MKWILFFLFFSFSFLSLCGAGQNELPPSSQITYMPDDTTLGPSTGTWCSMKIESKNLGTITGMGSYMFIQVNTQGTIEDAPSIGATRFGKDYKFILKNEDLTVEVRNPQTGQLLCTISGNKKKIMAQGTWRWPTQPEALGADFCNLKEPLLESQQKASATLEVSCR